MTEQHVPVDRLAAYAAGDLDASAALEVEAHVLLCTLCRADADAVARATAALAAVEPVAMPADVAARVDAAVAAARETSGPAGDVLPLAAKRRRPSFAGIAAVAAGIALVGAITVPLVTNSGDGAAPTASDTTGASVGTRRLESGLNYTSDELSDTLVRAISGVKNQSGLMTAFRGAAKATPDAAAAEQKASAAPEALDATAYSSLASLESDPARLASCVVALADGLPEVGRTPLLVDFALYEGAPALVVAFPTVRAGEIRPDRIDVFVVGPRCGVTPGDDHMLTFARFPRPSGL